MWSITDRHTPCSNVGETCSRKAFIEHSKAMGEKGLTSFDWSGIVLAEQVTKAGTTELEL